MTDVPAEIAWETLVQVSRMAYEEGLRDGRLCGAEVDIRRAEESQSGTIPAFAYASKVAPDA